MKSVPIGVEDFKRLFDEDYYFVDKSMLIKEVIREVVVLYTRPRRFGKTLNMSMLNYFYNIKEKENAYLFHGLEISNDKEVMQHQNKYPVIFLSLKDMKRPTFERQINKFKAILYQVLIQYNELIYSNQLDESEKALMKSYKDKTADIDDIEDSLLNISQCLHKHYKEKVIILIDEYDVPLQHAYLHGYYDEMVGFLRDVFSAALKTNTSLQQGILTGCLRIAKESIFTGMNNFKVNSIFSNVSSDKFGFTPSDVEQMLNYYELMSYKEEIQKWYDGYLFGKQELYNPWSTNMYVDGRLKEETDTGISYWVNTSGNDIVMRYIQQGDRQMKEEFDILVNKGSIVKKIKPELTYREMDDIENIYSFLLFTGYLKIGKEIDKKTYELLIPNEEVREVYANQFEEYFKEYRQKYKCELYKYLIEGNDVKIEKILLDILSKSISYYDNKESFYHGFLVGMLQGIDGYQVISNKESGEGRFDIVLKPESMRDKVIIIECKHSKSSGNLKEDSKRAIDQIQKKKYVDMFLQEGYESYMAYGIAFYKKQCYVTVNNI